MKIRFTLDDLPQDRKSCATCSGSDPQCARKEKRFPQGLIPSSCIAGDYGGYICCCPHYDGKL